MNNLGSEPPNRINKSKKEKQRTFGVIPGGRKGYSDVSKALNKHILIKSYSRTKTLDIGGGSRMDDGTKMMLERLERDSREREERYHKDSQEREKRYREDQKEILGEIKSFKGELKSDIQDLKTELKQDIKETNKWAKGLFWTNVTIVLAAIGAFATIAITVFMALNQQ